MTGSGRQAVPAQSLLPLSSPQVPPDQRLKSSCGLWPGDGLSQLCSLRGSLVGEWRCLSCDCDSQESEPEPLPPAWVPRAPLAGPRGEVPAHRGVPVRSLTVRTQGRRLVRDAAPTSDARAPSWPTALTILAPEDGRAGEASRPHRGSAPATASAAPSPFLGLVPRSALQEAARPAFRPRSTMTSWASPGIPPPSRSPTPLAHAGALPSPGLQPEGPGWPARPAPPSPRPPGARGPVSPLAPPCPAPEP